ncbi:COG1466: DNA polymerase III, delta subunit [Richelia intracellularis HM01]|nr:COG1466: DNA polymerase III, delta subunit [Richelia intracellularis HM01]
MESGERDLKLIAEAVDIANHKRIYFLQKEVQQISVQQLISTLPLLLDLEISLKQGTSQSSILKVKVIELCQLYYRN